MKWTPEQLENAKYRWEQFIREDGRYDARVWRTVKDEPEEYLGLASLFTLKAGGIL
jgi:hypothetical protein